MTLTTLKNNHQAIGVLGAFFAYLVWGLQPIYWKTLASLDAWIVIAHRYIWTTVVLFIFIIAIHQWKAVINTIQHLVNRPLNLCLLVLVSFIAVVNWWINIFAPMIGAVVELGIGLFLTPLMSVLLGVLFFRERLNSLQKLSMLLAVIGVTIMLVRFGSFPWIAIGVSSTWAVYGALKKKIYLTPTVAIFLESLIIAPFSIIFLMCVGGTSEFFTQLSSMNVTAYALIGTGILTSVPLITYTYATNNLPLNLLGLCQYLSPILTLCLGIFIYDEKFGWDELFPMTFIWISIIVFIIGQHYSVNFKFKQKGWIKKLSTQTRS